MKSLALISVNRNCVAKLMRVFGEKRLHLKPLIVKTIPTEQCTSETKM